MQTRLKTTFRGSLALAAALLHLCASAQSPEPGAWWGQTPWQDPDRGFHWYPPDAPPPKKPAPKVEDPVTPAPETKPLAKAKQTAPRHLDSIQTVEDLREELDWRKGEAIMRPSSAAVYSYLEAQKFSIDKSALFADVWRRTGWANGELVYSDRYPVINAAANSEAEFNVQRRQSVVSGLAKDYALLFFYRNDCRYCHEQAPILKMFNASFGMDVLPVSLDGDTGTMKRVFPNAKPDNGISMLVSGGSGIQRWPALYLVSKDKRRVFPLATGVLDVESIAERIRVTVTTKAGDEL